MSWWSTDDPRRTTALVGLLLAAAAVVGLGVGYLLSLSGDSPSTTATTSTSDSPAASPTTSPPINAARPTARAASEIERGITADVGYLVGARRENDGTHVTFDRVLLKMGKDAKDYAKKYHKKKPGPKGILLVNDNPMTRDLVLAPDVKVLGAKQLAGSKDLRPVPLDALLDAVASHGSALLLDLTYDRLGYVVQIQERDLP